MRAGWPLLSGRVLCGHLLGNWPLVGLFENFERLCASVSGLDSFGSKCRRFLHGRGHIATSLPVVHDEEPVCLDLLLLTLESDSHLTDKTGSLNYLPLNISAVHGVELGLSLLVELRPLGSCLLSSIGHREGPFCFVEQLLNLRLRVEQVGTLGSFRLGCLTVGAKGSYHRLRFLRLVFRAK